VRKLDSGGGPGRQIIGFAGEDRLFAPRRLFISPKTAEHHVGRIYAKLDLRSRAEAAAHAARELGPG